MIILFRLLALNVIFQVVLDVTSPSFVVEGRQWRSSVTEIFFHFFGAIWSDDNVSAFFSIINIEIPLSRP